MLITPGGDTSTGGTYLSEPGTYHLVITNVDEQPTKKDGTLIDNAMFRVDLSVVDGTTPNQKDKHTDLLFFHPRSDGSEGAHKLAKKKVDRFLLSTCLATREQIEKCESIEVDLPSCIGRQFMAKFEMDDYGEKPRLGLVFAEIYHVDDAAMKDMPKDAGALSLIPTELRWPGGRPAKGKAKTEAPKQEAPPVAVGGGDEFGDL